MARHGGPGLFEIRRRKMVERQIAPRGVTDPRVLEAMSEIPREIFVEEALAERAYSDSALPIGQGQTISQPYIAAKMTEMLAPGREHRVLEIGTGTGYQTALLARLAGEVFTVERIPALAERASSNLLQLGFRNVHLLIGDGSVGWPGMAPFDRILVAAAAPDVPPSLAAQLAPGGRMVLPVGDARTQVLTLVVREEGGWTRQAREGCVFVRLIGAEGWSEEG
ncbi:MAG TPA: protein-L-isoaspartate(D-aspartate) O-methyltransferase [Candidatus Saccharimonadales bacterium]|nr:protein-L-isoaspartate(D-aspartate) O-methyltransferase [Candidatus Saccharimonadales bacterium]